MMLIDKLVDNTIVITNYQNKLKILDELNKNDSLINVNFMTMKELVDKIYFSFDEKAIYFLMDKYKIKRDIAEVYLNNLYYISDTCYNNSKLDNLVKIKKELIDNNFLVFDEYFLDYIKNKKVVFYNYNYFKKIELNLIEKLKSVTEVEIISKDYNNYKNTIYEFDSIYDEVEFVAREIVKLIENGIDINNIKITNIDDDYIDIINSVFSMYNLSISSSSDKLISTLIAKEYFNLSGNISDRINTLLLKYKNNEILNLIISIVNKYVVFSDIDLVNEMIMYDFKNISIPILNKNNVIEVIDYKEYPLDDSIYVFMLNFNQNKIPNIYKDEEFITDNLKDNLLCDTTLDMNKLERESTINNILNIKNLVITYKLSTPFNSFYPSNLIGDLGFSVIKKSFSLEESYSDFATRFRLSKMIDNYIKTGVVTSDLEFLYSNYCDISYSTYNNKYKLIDKKLFRDYIENKFNLSYSSMDNYYKCPFRYYLSNVLKLDIYEEKFEAYIGSLFHYVLENALKGGSSVDILVSSFTKSNERVLSKKEMFFVNKLKKDIKFVLDVILEQIDNSNLKDMLFEERVEVSKTGDVSVTFKGFIDKIMYKENDDYTVVCIIDYKTGFTDINLGYVPFGLSMQLPVYLYLAKNSNKLNNVRFAGFYLQRVLHNEVSISSKKSYLDLKRENTLLYGYSNSDEDLLHEFDNTYKDSRFIKSMKLDSNGNFSRYSKILSDDKIDKLITITDKKIDEAILNISNACFDIKPKKTEQEVLGCKFCNFKDICFKESSDEEFITEDKTLSFLGGD